MAKNQYGGRFYKHEIKKILIPPQSMERLIGIESHIFGSTKMHTLKIGTHTRNKCALNMSCTLSTQWKLIRCYLTHFATTNL